MRRLKTAFLLLLLLVATGLVMVVAERAERMRVPGVQGTTGPLNIEPPPGVYPRGVRVALSPYQPRGQIVVMTDGTVPTARVGMAYEGAIRMPATSSGVEVLRAVEISGGGTGPLLSASYFVGPASPLPVVSLIAEPADLWQAEAGILANPTWRGREWERPAHLTLFLDGAALSLPVGLRVDGREPMDLAKLSLRVYARREYGASRLEAPLYPMHVAQSADTQMYKRLLLQAGTHDVVWSLLRDAVTAEVARELALPVAEGRFVWLFVNGSSWGLYRLTERVDRFMVADNYGLVESDVVVEGDARDGTDLDWDNLLAWVAANDLRDPDALAAFEARVDLDNLTDYLALSRVFGFPAEALVAIQPPGGRWFWIFEGGPGTSLEEPDLDLLADALLRNPDYRAWYAARVSRILNTSLTPGAINRHLDAVTTNLAEVYDHERLRWPGVPSWQDEAEAVRKVLAMRASDLADELDLASVLTLQPDPEGAAKLYVEGTRVDIDGSRWAGVFAATAAVDVTAVPAPGRTFAGWQVASEDGVQTVPSSSIVLSMTRSLTLTPILKAAVPEAAEIGPDAVVINEVWINDNGTRYRSLGDRPLEGDWVELLVRARGGVDLRGWRLTDNDTLATDTEGSIIFPDAEAFANVPCGTIILIVATESPAHASSFRKDDLGTADGRMVLYAGNGTLDVTTDPGFAIGRGNDALALLAPGPTSALDDDIGIDFVAEGKRVTAYSFGVLADGVTFDVPFVRLGADDGAFFHGRAGNDAIEDWTVDPTACESQDDVCLDTFPLVTPGRLNPGQQLYRVGCRLRGPAAP